MSGISTRRSITYWIWFLVFLIIGGPIYAIEGTIPAELHEMLDGLAVSVLFVALLAAGRAYLRRRSSMLAMLNIGLAGTLGFELLHLFGDTGLLSAWMASEAANFRSWSWHTARVFPRHDFSRMCSACNARQFRFG